MSLSNSFFVFMLLAKKKLFFTMAETTQPASKRRRVNEPTSSQAHKPSPPLEKQETASANTTAITTLSTTSSTSSNKVYVGNLHVRVQQVHLEKLFSPYGTVMNIHVCFHKETGRPKGYAFCQFANARQADAAMKALHGRKLLGKSLVVQSAKQEGTTTASTAKGSDSKKLVDKIEKLKQALKNETKVIRTK
jgi:RNA recognition motif-containing protein